MISLSVMEISEVSPTLYPQKANGPQRCAVRAVDPEEDTGVTGQRARGTSRRSSEVVAEPNVMPVNITRINF
jgi:hypothetical protein